MIRTFLLLPCLAIASQIAAQDYIVEGDVEVSEAILPGLVKHPMMAAFDDRGRLFVAENAGVNLDKAGLLKELPSSIRLLEDTDGDGVFDKSTLFADRMTFPQGALWVYDSLYVMSPPSLWRLADEDGDGRAEIREELATGFDFTGNAADVHGPFLHPNGRLYWTHGRKGFAIPDNDTGQIMEQGKAARIWSSLLSGGEVESLAGGGMDNPVELDFTDEGETIGTVNLFHGQPRGDTLVHWVHGGVYPRYDQGQVLSEFRRTGDLLPAAHNFGHVAISGMCRYRSGALAADWTDGWLTTHFNTAEVTLTKLQPAGSTYRGTETRTIFRAVEPDTHFTDVLEDRNGDLIVLDTGGWFRIGCPTSQIAKPDVSGMIYRLSKKGVPYQAPAYPDWGKLTSEQVSHHLGAPEDWLRDRAITELAVRGAPAMPELERILADRESAAIARINAVWTLARMKFSESADLIHSALTDPDAGVRQSACNAISVTRTWQIVAANQPAERAIELERNQTISGALANIVRGDEPAVARAAAAALGRMGEHRAIGTLTGRLGRSQGDRFLEHALIYALIEIDDFENTRPGLESSEPATVSGILRALDAMPSSQLQVLDVLPFLEADDEALRETAVSIVAAHREWDAALANAFFHWTGTLDDKRRDILRRLVPSFAGSPPLTDYLTSLVTADDLPHRQLGLELIALSPGIPFHEDWTPAFEKALAGDPKDALLPTAISALRSSKSDHFAAALESICRDGARSADLRLAAADALVRPNAAILPAVADLAMEIAQQPASPLRGKALGLLASSALRPEDRDRLAAMLPTFTPVDWGSFLQLFRAIDSPEQATILAEALVASPALGNLDAEQIRKRFAAHPEALARIEARTAELETERAQRAGRIEALVETLANADAAAGANVFATGKGACIACHRIGETGGQIGPDLSTIGRIRTGRDIYESVLFPSESIARDFDTQEIALKSTGAVLVGLVREHSDRGLQLVDPGGQPHTVPRSDIASIRRMPTSLMPSGLDQTLSAEDLRDLVAYLLSLK